MKGYSSFIEYGKFEKVRINTFTTASKKLRLKNKPLKRDETTTKLY